MRGAVNGMVDVAADPHTVFLEPRAAADHREQLRGRFSGIGVVLSINPENQVLVRRLIPDAPAARAGIEVGDQIVAVDGQRLTGQFLPEAIELIRGEGGQTVNIGVYRAAIDEEIQFEIERAEILPPTVWTRVADGYGVIEVTQFRVQTAAELHDALGELMGSGVEGLVLDLRGNGGGFLTAALGVAAQFLPDGSTVLIQTQRDGPNVRHRIKGEGQALRLPLTVLTDGGTASASEIVAAALRDNGRAPLLGQTTFGKGSVQISYDLLDDSIVKVTVGKWLTGNRVQLDGAGLEPDVVVGPATNGDLEDDDVFVQAALDLMRNDPNCCLIEAGTLANE